MKDFSWLSRTEALIQKEKVELLAKQHVLVVGMGGVGSYAAEFLVRAGIGSLTIVDGDNVDPTNRNRQLPAMKSTEGKLKTEVMQARLLDINPDLNLTIITKFLNPEDTAQIVNNEYDYIADCIDSITPKLNLITGALKAGKRIVSSMGAGGRLDPTKIHVADISKTYNCRLAFTMRKRLKDMGVRKGFKAVFSSELPLEGSLLYTNGLDYKKSAYGTISYLPAAFGGACASVIIRDLIEFKIK